MRHLGTEKAEDLAKQRFYWAEMYKDIDTYIRRKCPFVKEKQPNWEDRAWLVPIKSTYPFEIVSLDFLKLDKAKKILNMFLLWRITSPDMFRHLSPKPNLQKELQRSCTTITFSHMRFHLKFVMIMDVNSIIRYLQNYISFVASNHWKPLHIILVGMHRLSGWIEQSSACWKH